jgi:hypothetical protein
MRKRKAYDSYGEVFRMVVGTLAFFAFVVVLAVLLTNVGE